MPVVAERVRVPPLPVVHRQVLVAEDRVDDLPARVRAELRERVGPDELVLHHRERDRHAGHAAELRTPDAGADQGLFALDVAAVRVDAAHAPVPDVEAGDGDAPFERDALRLRAASQRRGGADGLRDAVGRDEIGPKDRGGVDQWDLLRRLLGSEERRAIDAVRAGEPDPALQLPHPFRGGRDLDPADAEPARLAVDRLEARVQLHRVPREPAHRARAVRLEHEPRRMRGRAPRLEQRALIDHEDVGDPQLGEVVRGARANDARSDDHELRAISHVRSPP